MIDALIYIGFVIIAVTTWKHFSKKFLSEDGLKWHAYMVSGNLSLFISVSFLIIAFEIQNWAEGNTDIDFEVSTTTVQETLNSCEQTEEKSLQSLYLQLQSFKGDKAFAEHGFNQEPYKQWYIHIQCIQKDRSSPDEMLVAADILLLGMEYKSSRGVENDFTQSKRESIKLYFDEVLGTGQGSRRRKL